METLEWDKEGRRQMIWEETMVGRCLNGLIKSPKFILKRESIRKSCHNTVYNEKKTTVVLKHCSGNW